MPIKVLVLNHATHLGGAEKVLLDLLTRMNRSKFDPLVLLPQDGPLKGELEKIGVECKIIRAPGSILKVQRKNGGLLVAVGSVRGFLGMIRGIVRLVREDGIQLIYTNSLKADVYGSIVGWLTGTPVVWRLHDFIGDNVSWPLRTLMVTLATRIAQKVLPVSRAVSEVFQRSGAPAHKLEPVYNGIEQSSPLSPALRTSLRDSLGLSTTQEIVGIFSWLIPWKGHEVFLKAAAIIKQVNPQVRFLVVGEPLPGSGYGEYLRKLSSDLEVAENVIFAGFRRDVIDLIQCMTVCVHASREPDPLPTVVLEAMASGVPVVATRVGGVPEMVVHNETGLLVPPDDAEELAKAILSILESPKHAELMARNALMRIEQGFKPANYVGAIERVLTEAIGRT